MAEDKRNVLSEHTKDMTPEQFEQLQEQLGSMTEEQLRDFRNGMDPDQMGFCGEESV